MFANFQESYYNKNPVPLVGRYEYKEKLPLIIIDCSKKNEILKSGWVDVKLEFETQEDFPTGTSAYS